MTAKRFEELRIWQDAKAQASDLYRTFGADSISGRDFGFRNQIQRCGLSVMNNIAEGFERKTDADFARFLDISKGSNGEVRSMLYLAEDLGYLDSETGEKMRHHSEKLSRAIQTLSKHLRT